MKHIIKWIAVAALVVSSIAAAQAATITVFAAASLKEAMDQQARLFEAKSGDRVVVSYAGSNALARQIESGAPADLFISADLDWMDYVEQRQLLAPGTRVTLLKNTLVLIAPASSKTAIKIAPGFDLAGALGNEKLALANPDSVPAGKYARSAFVALGVWNKVEKQVVRTDNVRAALALVSRQEATFGVVYGTDATADKAVRIVDTFPASSHPPILYPAALIGNSPSAPARALLDYLKSAGAGPVWVKYGFGLDSKQPH
jgi:molybdate transport system substrate-binding protein